MNKRVIVVTVAVLVLFGGAFALIWDNNGSDHPDTQAGTSSSTQQNSNSSNQTDYSYLNAPAGASITVTGTMECLQRKDTTGPQTMECAIGLKADDGTHFALSSSDPTQTGSIPTGQKVTVTGIVSQRASQYDIVGLIAVSSIQRL